MSAILLIMPKARNIWVHCFNYKYLSW